MGANSAISWCDNTVNFWIGCTKVSTAASGGGACDFCYAERDFDLRKHVAKWGSGQPRHRTKTWGEPLKWNAKAEAFKAQHGHYPRVFANSLSDFFDNEVPRDWHVEALQVISMTRNLCWMLTTKRAVNIPKIVAPEFFRANQHVGIIISICNQMEANRDIPRLLNLKAELGIAWVGLSIEPMLGPIDIRPFITKLQVLYCPKCHYRTNRLTEIFCPNDHTILGSDVAIDWVIAGGESGPHARPMHPDWARSLRDQCAAARVPFHFKQWGEWLPWHQFGDAPDVDDDPEQTKFRTMEWEDGRWNDAGYPMWCQWTDGEIDDDHCTGRVGRTRAGRLLDGFEHNDFPESMK